MTMIPETRLNFNHKVRFDFDGGDLSSDSGLILIAEFMDRLGMPKVLQEHFRTKDKAVRVHKDYENLLQSLFQIFSPELFIKRQIDEKHQIIGAG